MSSVKQGHQGAHSWLVDAEVIPDLAPQHFDIRFWQSANLITGHSTGRGTTYFVHHNHTPLVLRHYRRGGLIGKLLSDQYLFTGLSRCRSFQEFHLLNWMHAQGLPVPRPVAAHVHRSGPIYRADLILQQINKANDLHHILCASPLEASQWQNVGKTIARMHQAQIYHHDLNIHNLMQDEEGKIWLIDFDRCYKRHGTDWQPQNLARLKRSLEKESARTSPYYYQPDDFTCLLQGYHQQLNGNPHDKAAN
ncbi:3-deoxy-D-manno-octulosonic acid kinase [Bowmanella pacifica]|uniref:3-deoxy-D-manno-octulosonic acid kinase n=1 Tax=Bowmanella pacifica TaxID=502051 RepID=UPI00166BFD18|nr:3-deoxy-D-manno-octulosonic acid kinase [Bowmanella pacifica]